MNTRNALLVGVAIAVAVGAAWAILAARSPRADACMSAIKERLVAPSTAKLELVRELAPSDAKAWMAAEYARLRLGDTPKSNAEFNSKPHDANAKSPDRIVRDFAALKFRQYEKEGSILIFAVDSQNRAGAMLRSEAVCLAADVGADVVSISTR